MPRWLDTGGPFAQDVTAMLIDTRSPGTVFAGHANGAVSRSTDDGRTWEALSSIASSPAILSLIHHPELPLQMYAATSRGAFLTTDGGRTWTPTPIDPAAPTAPCPALAIDPFSTQQMYAGLNGRGIHRSTDGGIRWTPCNLGVSTDKIGEAEVLSIAISPVDPNLVVAGLSYIGVMKSTDRGQSWSMVTRELAASGTVPTTVVLHSRLKDALCFGTRAGDIFRSVNGGVTWSPTRQARDETAIGSLVASPTEPDHIFATSGSGVMESNDFGVTWRDLSLGLPRLPCSLVLSATAHGKLMFVSGQGVGVQRSLDGGVTWQPADRGLGGSTVTALATRPGSGVLYATVGSAVYLYNRTSSSWISASSGLNGGRISSVVFETPPDSLVYAGTLTGLFRSSDGGNSWSQMPKTFGPNAVEFFDAHLSIRTRMFAGTSAGLFVSTDRGLSWRPSRPQGETYRVRSFTYSMDNAGIMHAATSNRGIVGSSDAGLNWESNRYGLRTQDVLGITRDSENNRLMYCWTADGEGYRSTNRGMEWDGYAPPWQHGDRIVLWISRASPHLAVALVNGRRVYSTSSAGATWRTLLVEEPPAEVEAITYSSGESALYAGTRGRGVYRLTLPPSIAPEQR
jgi:photosystem II stability/assembly factor-like uncharacterized protein